MQSLLTPLGQVLESLIAAKGEVQGDADFIHPIGAQARYALAQLIL